MPEIAVIAFCLFVYGIFWFVVGWVASDRAWFAGNKPECFYDTLMDARDYLRAKRRYRDM